MKKGLTILTGVLFGLVLFTGGAMAYDFGTNITISDENYDGKDWHKNQEDQEVENGMQHGQIWDLEGFFLNGNSLLSIVGGYDFIGGEGGSNRDKWKSGDLFIDIDGDAKYGDIDGTDGHGNLLVNNTFGYDYVIDLDYNITTSLWDYDVFSIDGDAMVKTAFYQQNQGSSPWKYVSGGTDVLDENGNVVDASGHATYETYNTDILGFDGGYHNAIQGIDLSFLGDNINTFTASFTMQCGNDHLMGDPVPEPSTIILLGLGILGLVGFRKKFVK